MAREIVRRFPVFPDPELPRVLRSVFPAETNWKLAPNRLTQALQELQAAGREVLDLTISNPTRAELPDDAEAILQALNNPKAMDYDPQPKGLRRAREAVAQYYSKQFGDVDPESIVLDHQHQRGLFLRVSLIVQWGRWFWCPSPLSAVSIFCRSAGRKPTGVSHALTITAGRLTFQS